jgi:hypothetical protein
MMKIILTLLATLSLNANAVEYQSPRTLSLGGAGRGAPFLNDSIYLNPSFGSFQPIYAVAAGYNWFNNSAGSGRNYNASIQDSRTEMFQAGVAYTKREQSSAVNIGASKQLIAKLGVGIGTKTIIDNNSSNLTTDFLISSSFLATRWMYASIIVDNMLDNESDHSRNLFRTFYIGLKFIPFDLVQIYVDPLYSPTYAAGKKAGISAGVEITMLGDFYARAGRFIDGEVAYLNTRGEGYGLGLGYLGPKFHFDYAFNRVSSSHLYTSKTSSNSVEMTVFF